MKQHWCVDCQRCEEPGCARHKDLGLARDVPPTRPPESRRAFGEPMRLRAQTPLTENQIASITVAVDRVMDAGGWGSVELIVERGHIQAVRTTTSQLFLDALADRPTKSHGAERDEREARQMK